MIFRRMGVHIEVIFYSPGKLLHRASKMSRKTHRLYLSPQETHQYNADFLAGRYHKILELFIWKSSNKMVQILKVVKTSDSYLGSRQWENCIRFNK